MPIVHFVPLESGMYITTRVAESVCSSAGTVERMVIVARPAPSPRMNPTSRLLRRNGRPVSVVLVEALVVEVVESLANRKRAKSGVDLNRTG